MLVIEFPMINSVGIVVSSIKKILRKKKLIGLYLMLIILSSWFLSAVG